MTQKVFTIGYSGRKPQELKQICENLDAVIFDIRFSPRSRVAHWSGKRLGELLGDRYLHVKALGNVNYKGGPIKIMNYKEGRARIEANKKPVILMCACSSEKYHTCHRRNIAEMLKVDGFEVKELPPPDKKKEKKPPMTQLELL